MDELWRYAGPILILYWTAILIGLPTLTMLLPAAVLFAPFAGIVSALQARRLGIANWRYYGVVGAVYSVHLLLPWLYIMFRLAGTAVHPLVIGAVYIVVFVVWAIYLPVSYVLLWSFPRSAPAFWFVLYVGIVAFCVSVLMLVLGFARYRQGRRAQQAQEEYRHRPLDFVYLVPFAFVVIHPLAMGWHFFVENSY